MEMERPNFFNLARTFSTFSAKTVTNNVVRDMVWQIHGTIPVNKGIRILVVLEVENTANNSSASLISQTNQSKLLETQVFVGGQKVHDYEPFYFTSTKPQGSANPKAKEDYTYTSKDNTIKGVLETSGKNTSYAEQSARQETIDSASTVAYYRIPSGNTTEKENVEDLNGTRAQVVSGGMKFYTPQTPPSAKIHMDTKLDGETAVLTVGTANGNSNDATAGTIRNEPKRYAAYMDLTMDFLSGNKNLMEANKRYGLKDLKELQGFKLNRLPSWDELAYNAVSGSDSKSYPDSDRTAVMYIQFRGDLNEDGELKDSIKNSNLLDVAYDPDYPAKDRYAKDGYRKVYSAEEIKALGGHDSELEQGEEWYYWHTPDDDYPDGRYRPVDPREIARLRLEYIGLNAVDKATGDYLTVPVD